MGIIDPSKRYPANHKCFADITVIDQYRRLDAETAENQHFSLPLDQMRCIRDNASPEVLHKLYQCCKWFPMRRPAVICSSLYILGCDHLPQLRINQSEIVLTAADRDPPPMKIFVMDSLILPHFLRNHRNYFSKLVPLIRSCAAKTVEIETQHLRWLEIKPLIQHGKVKRLILGLGSRYQCAKYEKPDFLVEDVMVFMQNASDISLNGVPCTPQTIQKLDQMKFQQKFDFFDIGGMRSAELDPEEYANFLNSHCAPGVENSWAFRARDRDILNSSYINEVGQLFLDKRKASNAISNFDNLD